MADSAGEIDRKLLEMLQLDCDTPIGLHGPRHAIQTSMIRGTPCLTMKHYRCSAVQRALDGPVVVDT